MKSMDKNAEFPCRSQRNAKFWAPGFCFVGKKLKKIALTEKYKPTAKQQLSSKMSQWHFSGWNLRVVSTKNINLIRSNWESVEGHIAKTQPLSAIMCHSFIHNSDFSIDSKTLQNRDKIKSCGSTIQPQFCCIQWRL